MVVTDTILAGGDAVQVVIVLIIVVISIIVSLVKKANELAQKERRRRSGQPGGQGQSTPWEDVKRFLQEAGVETQHRSGPKTAKRLQRPQPKVRQAPRPRVAPRSSIPGPTPGQPQPAPRIEPPRSQLAPRPEPPPPPPPREEPRLQRPVQHVAPPAPQPAQRQAPAPAMLGSVRDLRKLSAAQLRNAILLREVFGAPLSRRPPGMQSEFLP